MTDAQQREAARQFFYRWRKRDEARGRIIEEQDARSFWIELLSDILGVENVTQRVEFEKSVAGPAGNTNYIDIYIPETRVLIEHKSKGIDLGKPQPGHKKPGSEEGLTPYEQAKMYDNGLPFDEKARWIITSNFFEIWIYDMNQRNPERNVVKVALPELATKFHTLDFLVNKEQKRVTQETEVSVEAGRIVGELYDAFHKQYRNPDDPRSLESLNKLCVRLVFLLYGEDDNVFGRKNIFHDYLSQFAPRAAREALKKLFRVLDQRPEERDEYLAEDDPILASFPYVNGGLFEGNIEIPPFTDEIMELILNRASENFDWSGISASVFGACFESTLNPETRRAGGMHYTSPENLHKVIDPLFLDDLKAELDSIKSVEVWKTRKARLEAFQKKLSSLYFFDPAAGSGNFLTITYTELRTLENEVIALLARGQMSLGDVVNPIRVSISQFAGLEINDFAVVVARTALWIAENQMLRRTEDILHMDLDFLPLKTSARIVEGNALRTDWNRIVDKSKLSYIISNPPFIGARMMAQGSKQKKEVQDIFGDIRDVQDLDYVTCWYKLAAKFILGTKIEACFVSTNSICQGSQVPILWNVLLNEFHLKINYAYQTFRWDSESIDKAAVHCVIVAVAAFDREQKRIFTEGGGPQIVENISPYLTAGASEYVVARKTPICDVPKMCFGNQPRDGGNFVISPEERLEILEKEPGLEKWLHPYIGAEEFINAKKRYCLWLADASPLEISRSRILREKVDAVRRFRLASKAKTTNGYAKVPHCFAQRTQPEGAHFLLIPSTSSENRRYVPIGFMTPDIISSNAAHIIPNAGIYHFGVLTSNVHMSWMRTVCGRLEMRYRYSKEIVYNTFPWPEPSESQRRKIEETAQGILAEREKYPDTPLAVLYDPLTMPPGLQRAHARNDAAVMKAYGMPIKETDEAACVAWLMRLYQEKVGEVE